MSIMKGETPTKRSTTHEEIDSEMLPIHRGLRDFIGEHP